MAASSDIYKFYKRFEEREKKFIEQSVDKATTLAIKSLLRQAEVDIKNIYKEVIDSFYKDYTPYDYIGLRNYSLFDLLDISYNENAEGAKYGSFHIDYDPSKATKFRNGNGDVFELSFVHGWHGGARSGNVTHLAGRTIETPHPNPGVPYYRNLIYSKNGSHWFSTKWTRVAEVMDPSPLEEFNKRISEYADAELQSKYNDYFNGYFNEIIKEARW